MKIWETPNWRTGEITSQRWSGKSAIVGLFYMSPATRMCRSVCCDKHDLYTLYRYGPIKWPYIRRFSRSIQSEGKQGSELRFLLFLSYFFICDIFDENFRNLTPSIDATNRNICIFQNVLIITPPPLSIPPRMMLKAENPWLWRFYLDLWERWLKKFDSYYAPFCPLELFKSPTLTNPDKRVNFFFQLLKSFPYQSVQVVLLSHHFFLTKCN